MVTETVSAIGKDHQIASSPPSLDIRYASGSSAISCLAVDISILGKPLPKAWNTEPETMQKPANTKLKLIILNAGMPILIMSGDALKNESSCLGKIWNIAIPTAIIVNVYIRLNLIVLTILCLLRAP